MPPPAPFQVFTHRVVLHPEDLRYRTAFEPGSLERDFRPECGQWRLTSEGLEGAVSRERAAACWHAGSFPGDVALSFTASTVAPHDRDVNCYWSGAGTIYGEGRKDCHVGGLGGWWGHKHGIERYPEGGWLALSGGGPLPPGRRLQVLAGRLGSWQFLFLDGRLAVEAHDPAPLDGERFARVGLATWASRVTFHDLAIYRIRTVERGRDLTPEPAAETP